MSSRRPARICTTLPTATSPPCWSSGFVTDAGPMYFWLPCLVCLLALAELIWRSGRLAIVFVTGHIGATLLVACGLTAAIEFHWLPTVGGARQRRRGQLRRRRGAGRVDVGDTATTGARPGSVSGFRSASRRPRWARISPTWARHRADAGDAGRHPGWPARPAGRRSAAHCWRCPRSSGSSCWRMVPGRRWARSLSARWACWWPCCSTRSRAVRQPAGRQCRRSPRSTAESCTHGTRPRVQPVIPQLRQRLIAVLGGQVR